MVGKRGANLLVDLLALADPFDQRHSAPNESEFECSGAYSEYMILAPEGSNESLDFKLTA